MPPFVCFCRQFFRGAVNPVRVLFFAILIIKRKNRWRMDNGGQKSRDELIERLQKFRARVGELESWGRELNESERMLAHSQRVAHVGNWTWDFGRRILLGSEETYRIFDLPPGAQISHERLTSIIFPEDRPILKDAMEESLKSGFCDVEFRIASRSGDTKYLHVKGELESSEGSPVALKGMVQDITERKEKEDELKRLIDELKAVQRISHLASWTWDISGDNFSGSEEAYNILETAQGVPISYAQFMEMIHPDDRPAVVKAIEDALKRARYDVEFRIITGTGRTKHLKGLAELSERKNGRWFLSGIVQDVTARKELENEQKRLSEELQAALERIKTLSGLVPVCANCKKVKDGPDYRRQLEKFIEEHSEAEFTDSLCPDCQDKLYGKKKAG